MFFWSWFLLIAGGVLISLGVFFWALRTGQFSDQERARYLPLADEFSPPLVESPAKLSKEVYALLFAIGLGIVAMIAA
ncbi:MAG: cbb3-type cytochrome oxidase assembly protein, partial [Syntrophaceae bacterium]|nr:cbb3-type cytochrome oxidase assembly protein [Syntrophaceae bacterium]